MDCNTTQEMLQLATNRLDYYVYLTITSMILSAIAIIASIYYNRKQLEKNDNRHQEALEQSKEILQANHDFVKRSFTTTFIKDFVNDLNKTRKRLDELTSPEKEIIKDDNGTYINFTTWIEANKILLPKTLHEWVCEGEEEYKRVAKADKNPCVTTNDKEEIVTSILHIINIYEQIGVALKNDVIDKEILSNTFKAPIARNYTLFEKYIKHRIEDHGDINFGNSFKWVYEELHSSERDTQRESASKQVG